MKSVFSSNSELCHVWANEVSEHGNGNSMRFYNGKLYSFSTCIAEIIGETVIFNNYTYSSYTSRHQSHARRAIHGKKILYVNVPFRGLDNLYLSQRDFNELVIAPNEKKAAEYLAKATRARKHADIYLAWAHDILKMIKEYADFLALEYTEHDLSELQAAALENERREREAAKARRAEKIREQAEALEKWRAGESVWRSFELTALRLKGENIETSRGASIPVDHAIKAWPMLRKMHEKNADIDLSAHSIKFGLYEMKAFQNDNLIVGCHTIPFAEVQNIANQLGL